MKFDSQNTIHKICTNVERIKRVWIYTTFEKESLTFDIYRAPDGENCWKQDVNISNECNFQYYLLLIQRRFNLNFMHCPMIC